MKSERRREELRRSLPKPTFEVKGLFQRRDLVSTLLISFAFFLAAALVVIWSQNQTRNYVGQIVTSTKLNRIEFQVPDEKGTTDAQNAERELSPRVYVVNGAYLEGIEASLLGLPVALEGQTEVAEINEDLRLQYNLDDSHLEAMQAYVVDSQPTERWLQWVEVLVKRSLIDNPMIDSQEWQRVLTERRHRPEFIADARTIQPSDREVIQLNTDTGDVDQSRLADLVQRAGFDFVVASLVTTRLAYEPEPVFRFDPAKTQDLAAERAASVERQFDHYSVGEVIYTAGDRLSPEQIRLIEVEQQHYLDAASTSELVVSHLGSLGVTALVAIFLAAYLIVFYPRIVRNPLRVAAVCALLLGMQAICVTVLAEAPQILYLAGVSTALVVAIVAVVAYDQRCATTLTGLYIALATFSLGQSIGFFIVLMFTSAVAIATLRELRNRNSVIRAAGLAAGAGAVATVLLGMFEMPMVDGVWREVLGNAGWAASASLGVGFLMLGILPTVERMFDITTGMSLVELRDPRHPLLRQLQERAPGSYNHSLQVASVAEAAADAIGANGLLVYVGAMYHDIGKMNKPGYFVENQSGGPSKHEKLSPAMSLLVIVGHVKDGIELAKEYGLPRILQHFIESHHGTTLVEYFYHAAKTKAEMDGERVEEIEYRYPGPKPRTREAAVLMLADAVESATRAMDEPTPASIENLVRKLSRKRLMDRQFDDCDLTLRELRTIEDSIIKSIWALHHGRIAYPTSEAIEETPTTEHTTAVG